MRSRIVSAAVLIGIGLGVAWYLGDQKKKVWRTGELAPVVRVRDAAEVCYKGNRSITFWYSHDGRELEISDSIPCTEEIHDPSVAVFKPDDPTTAYLLTSARRKIREGGSD